MDKQFSEEQFWRMCDLCMSDPVPLGEADLTRPFVYAREYGVFYCPSGMHQAAMSLLLAFRHNCRTGVEVAEKLKLDYSSGTADEWLLSTPGACFRSSVAKKVQAGLSSSLSLMEKRVFKPVEYAFEGVRDPRGRSRMPDQGSVLKLKV